MASLSALQFEPAPWEKPGQAPLTPKRIAPRHQRARPFLKWVGGKTQLLAEILARAPREFERYFEPFVGGGAVYFSLQPQKSFLSDINPHLVRAYKTIRDDVDALIRALKKHKAEQEYYYKVRAQDPDRLKDVHATARLIFLNRTCFNGLYRVNKKGQFNVPFGRYKNPKICDEDNLRLVSEALKSTNLRHCDVWTSLRRARANDFVYLDPPYDPISETASFTSYAKEGFGKAEQEKLAMTFANLAQRGVKVMLSNSDTPFIRSLYKDFHIHTVYARRAINRRADARGPVPEVLVTSYRS